MTTVKLTQWLSDRARQEFRCICQCLFLNSRRPYRTRSLSFLRISISLARQDRPNQFLHNGSAHVLWNKRHQKYINLYA